MQKLFINEIDWYSSETFYFLFYWIFTGRKEVHSDSYVIRYIERYAISFINSFEISSTGKGILKDKENFNGPNNAGQLSYKDWRNKGRPNKINAGFSFYFFLRPF